MMIKTMIGAFALTLSAGAFAAEPTPPAPKKECCCKKGEDGKMACCDKGDKAGQSGDSHDSHNMDGMSHK